MEVSRRGVVAPFLAIAAHPVALASFEYMVVALQTEMGFSSDQANALTLVPAAASLLVMFVAGSLGDHLGHRRVMVAGAVLYCAGAVLAAVAPNLVAILAARALGGIGASVLTIIGLAVVNEAFTEPAARARVYGAFAALTPAVFILTPPVAAALADSVGWRAVPVLWLVLGVATSLLALRVVPGGTSARKGREELLTPILAGLALTGIAMAVVLWASDAALALASLAIGMVALAVLVVLLRRAAAGHGRPPSLDLRIVRKPWVWLLLVALLVATMPNLFFFTNLLLQYRYAESLTTIALLLIVPQLAAVAGGLASGQISARIGARATAVLALGMAAATSLGTLLVRPESPVWVPVAALALCAAPIAGAAGPLTESVMDLAPADGSGAASSLRDAVWNLGGTIGSVLIGTLGFVTFEKRLAALLNSTSLDTGQADAIAAEIRNGAVVADLAAGPQVSDPTVREMLTGGAQGLLEAQSLGFSVVGVVSSAVYALAAVLLVVFIRRSRAAGVQRSLAGQ